jgi:predicted aconitase with swiveling domain
MRESKGSGSAPGGIAEAIRLGNAPAGIILVTPDINLAGGAEVAETLYGRGCTLVAVTDDDFPALCRAARLSISVTGEIRDETV